MSKTTKKNNAAIEWPLNTHFTMKDIFKKYPDFIEITARFRVKRGLENKEIVAIGKIKPAIGRPQLVFAKANPTKELLETATKAGVLPLEEKSVTVHVGEVNAPTVAPKKAKTEATTKAVTPTEVVTTPTTV